MYIYKFTYTVWGQCTARIVRAQGGGLVRLAKNLLVMHSNEYPFGVHFLINFHLGGRGWNAHSCLHRISPVAGSFSLSFGCHDFSFFSLFTSANIHPLARRKAPAEGRRPKGEGTNIDRRLVPYHGKSMRIQSHIEFIYIFICINGLLMRGIG